MKTRLFLLSLIACCLFFVGCDNDDDPNTLPKTEAELKSAITKKWDINSNNDYKSIEFQSDGNYIVTKQNGETITGIYTIGSDLKTLTLVNFGTISLVNLTADNLSFTLKPENGGNETSFICTPNTDNPNNLPTTEAELKTKITKKWDISSNDDYKSIEFKSDGTYVITKQNGKTVTNSYTIGSDLKTLTLTNFGTITLTELDTEVIKFTLKINGSDNTVNIQGVPSIETVETLLSEILEQRGEGEYKPYRQFKYDASGNFEEIIHYKDGYLTGSFTFERDNNNRITSLVYTYINGTEFEGTFALNYENGYITSIEKKDSYYQDGNTTTYYYIWENGMIIKRYADDEENPEIYEYDKDSNYTRYKAFELREVDGNMSEATWEATNEYNVNQTNWYKLLPLEYILAQDLIRDYDLKYGTILSKNNVAKTDYNYTYNSKHPTTDELLWERSYHSIWEYEYELNNEGLVIKYTETSTLNGKLTDYTDPSKDFEYKDEVHISNYKFEYIELEY